MPEREKVMRGLERCMRENNTNMCGDCPYHASSETRFGCMQSAMRDALALLREQEARVMTLEEMELREESVFLEINGEDGAIVLIQNADYCGLWVFLSVTPGFWNRCTLQAEGYNKDWRCWSKRPTEEQRMEVPWDD